MLLEVENMSIDTMFGWQWVRCRRAIQLLLQVLRAFLKTSRWQPIRRHATLLNLQETCMWQSHPDEVLYSGNWKWLNW